MGIRQPYYRVVGIQVDMEGSGRSAQSSLTPNEEEDIRRLAATPNIYEIIAKSIAPSIYGSLDIKKAIACLLFGGSRKRCVLIMNILISLSMFYCSQVILNDGNVME